MDLVPNADDNEAILQAMQRLKVKMNHYYYVKMLEEIGISGEDLEFNQQLKGLSEHFTDLISKVGENIILRKINLVKNDSNTEIFTYTHNSYRNNIGKICFQID